MESSTRNSLLIVGLGWSAVWIFLGIIRLVSFNFLYIAYEIPAIILIIIAMYNWGAGIDLTKKQTAPIENDFNFNEDELRHGF